MTDSVLRLLGLIPLGEDGLYVLCSFYLYFFTRHLYMLMQRGYFTRSTQTPDTKHHSKPDKWPVRTTFTF